MAITITSAGQLIGLACLVLLAFARATMLRSQGVSILSVDGSRTTIQKIADAIAFFALLYWLYVTVSYRIAPQQVVVPNSLNVIVFTNTAVKWLGILISSLAVVIYGLGV